ncbi:hypothetical protein K502DRAFT_326250 [Neoconidiobolus thromboides FSU 785]|nr:hypothetical protein K502DRAFT_326250 [Neoconidiobolus thromboides FSU 785]
MPLVMNLWKLAELLNKLKAEAEKKEESKEPSKITANVNYVVGAVKENVGHVLGNESLKATGLAQKAKGDAEYKAAEPNKLNANVNYAVGVVKENVGHVLGNKSLEATGAAQKAEGSAEAKAVDVENSTGEPSKINANLNYAIGAVKENVGHALGNKSLESSGAAQKAKGDAEFKAAEALAYGEGVKDNLKGNVKDTVGSAIGNEQMQAEGKALKLEGDLKKEINSHNL